MMSRHTYHPRLITITLIVALTIWLVMLDAIWTGVAR